MKKKTFVVITVFLAVSFLPPAAHSYEETFTTGKQWLKSMTLKEKFMSIILPMALFQKYGVPFKKAPQEYVPLIDRVIAYNPELAKEDVANIFASAVYKHEPESRPAFDSMAREFRRRYRQYNDWYFPSLSIRSPQDSEFDR